MEPSATEVNNLACTLGSPWDVVQADALASIRSEEGVPSGATSMAVSIDGVMLGMRKEKGTPGQEDAPRPAGFQEASSGTISLCDANRKCLRTVCYGRMPEAREVSLKEDVLTEAAHWMKIRPELKIVFIAGGAPENWRYCNSGTGLLARLAAFERGARCRLRLGRTAGAAPLRDASPNPEGRAGRHRGCHPSAALPGEKAPPPEGQLPRPRLLSQETAPHALRGNPHQRAANRKWARGYSERGSV